MEIASLPYPLCHSRARFNGCRRRRRLATCTAQSEKCLRRGVQQSGKTFARGGGDRDHLLTPSLHRLRKSRIALSGEREIDLVRGDDLRLSRQGGAVIRQLPFD